MDERLKQRLVGAAVLVLLAVIFIPMILDRPSEPSVRIEHPTLPPLSGTEFSSRIIPLTEPETSLVQAERAARPPAPPPAPAEPVEPEKPTATVIAAAKAPEMKKAPEAKTEAPPEPSPAAAKAEGAPSAFAIQLGSFSSAKNAMALRDRLKKKGYVAFIESAQVEGKEITRVFVGPNLARKRAEELVIKLQKETDLKGMIVQYPES